MSILGPRNFLPGNRYVGTRTLAEDPVVCALQRASGPAPTDTDGLGNVEIT